MPVLIHLYDKPALYRYSSILHRYVYTHIYTYLCTYIYFPEGMFYVFFGESKAPLYPKTTRVIFSQLNLLKPFKVSEKTHHRESSLVFQCFCSSLVMHQPVISPLPSTPETTSTCRPPKSLEMFHQREM